MVQCIICDYDLQGLDPNGNCPECGNSIQRSMRGDLLRFADQIWLAKLELGARLITTGLITVAATYATNLLYLLLTIFLRNSTWPMNVMSMARFGLLCLGFLGGLALILSGLWMFSSIEPRIEARSTLRPKVFKILSILALPSIIVWTITMLPLALPNWFNLVVAWMGFTVAAVHMLLFVDHVQSIDRRCAEKNEKRRDLLDKYRSQGMGCAVVSALLSVAFLAPMTTGLPPMLPTRQILPLGWVILVWIAIISFARGTRNRVALEMAIAKTNAENDESNQKRVAA